jgi:hypothetical protein
VGGSRPHGHGHGHGIFILATHPMRSMRGGFIFRNLTGALAGGTSRPVSHKFLAGILDKLS